MTDKEGGKNKHLTNSERGEIEACLNCGMTFKAIAQRIGKDQTTISKEIKKHIVVRLRIARTADPDKEKTDNCPKLLRPPFVCNPCKERHYCRKQKKMYEAKRAHEEYLSMLSGSREGIPLTKESFYEMDAVITEGIKRGQRLYHIMRTNDIPVSSSTVYRHLKNGYLSVGPLDFPRVVKFKQRSQRRSDSVPKAARIGRSYKDFIVFLDENDIDDWVEMDTVIGRTGGKVILTIEFVTGSFMAGLLLNNKTAAEAADAIRSLKRRFLSYGISYAGVIPVALTDNGGEFSCVQAFENSLSGIAESSLFFCDPNKAYQKPYIEKNHSIFRNIAPKGVSFDSFSQDAVNLIFSHVNSVKRKIFNGKTPYEIFTYIHCEKTAAALGIVPIPAREVIQSPLLLKQLPL